MVLHRVVKGHIAFLGQRGYRSHRTDHRVTEKAERSREPEAESGELA